MDKMAKKFGGDRKYSDTVRVARIDYYNNEIDHDKVR